MDILKLIGDFNVKKANNRREEATTRRINTLLTDSTDFLVKEAYKTARTNIRFSLSSEKGCKKIIITSASPHEGKTTTCLNLAIAFAQTDAKVLIIDADLRKPRIYRHLSIERDNGLSDLLCGLTDIKTAIKHCPDHNLDCITSGQIPPNPAELLSSQEMEQLLEELGQVYDYIFIDTPPVTVVTEAAAMAKAASGVILVIRQNNTIYESIDRARDSLNLASAKILGYILNDVDTGAYGYGYGKYGRYGKARRYSYRKGYGGYGYGYGYGYDYSNNYGSYGYGYGYKDRKRAEKSEHDKAGNTQKKPVEKQSLLSVFKKEKPEGSKKKAGKKLK